MCFDAKNNFDYLVSFQGNRSTGGNSVGDITLSFDSPISSEEDINELKKCIKETTRLENVTIINIIRLPI